MEKRPSEPLDASNRRKHHTPAPSSPQEYAAAHQRGHRHRQIERGNEAECLGIDGRRAPGEHVRRPHGGHTTARPTPIMMNDPPMSGSGAAGRALSAIAAASSLARMRMSMTAASTTQTTYTGKNAFSAAPSK